MVARGALPSRIALTNVVAFLFFASTVSPATGCAAAMAAFSAVTAAVAAAAAASDQ